MQTIVLLSGGLDSATVLAICRAEGDVCHALSFHYGQRHKVELQAAAAIARALGAASHQVCNIDLRCLSGSSLTGQGDVPKGRDEREIGEGIPSTYVPARNTLFVAHAIALAESIGVGQIAVGINALDYSGYPDCRPEWLAAMQEVARLGTKVGVAGQPVKIAAPLVAMSKAEIIRKGVSLGVDYSLTLSCYDPSDDGAACGACDACIFRRRGFEQAAVPDPTRYR
jgi:7-cyano-7-deazaguanine synthase